MTFSKKSTQILLEIINQDEIIYNFALYPVRMKIRSYITVLSLLVSDFQVGAASFLNTSIQFSSREMPLNGSKNCCCENSKDTLSCCGSSKNDQNDDGCGDRSSCHIFPPIIVSLIHDGAVGNSNEFIFSQATNTWGYSPPLPRLVYFPIWSPPKLS